TRNLTADFTFCHPSREFLIEAFPAESSLTKYFIQAIPPIHVIVQNGHVTLKGVVGSAMDSQLLAYTAASGVPNVFDVKNELVVEGGKRLPNGRLLRGEIAWQPVQFQIRGIPSDPI